MASPWLCATIWLSEAMDAVVGRDVELRRIREFLEDSRDGAGALVLRGEAGIGKTSVWLAGIEEAHDASSRVLAARPAAAERDLAHAGLGDLLEGVLDELLPALPPPRRHALEVALLLAEADTRPPDARAVGIAVLTGLRLLAESGPVIVAVDDVQWLDPSSAGALEFALRRLKTESIRLLLARRSGEPGPAPERTLPADRVEQCDLPPLSVGAIHKLLRQRLGHSFPRPTLLRLHGLSGGNPLFALELARAFERAGSAPATGEPFPVPETIELLLHDRLDALPSASRPILLAAATAAEPTVSLLQAGWPGARRALEVALKADVLVLDNERPRFAHPLLASVLYERAGSAERRRVHATLAKLVTDPIERARHLALAVEGPDATVARRLEEAAGHARARGASIAAADLGDLAIRATPAVATSDQNRRVLQAARDHLAAGSDDRVRALGRDMLSRVQSGRLRAETLLLLSELEGQEGNLNEEIELLHAALHEARGAPDLELVTKWKLGNAVRFSEGTAAGISHARAALALAERIGDDALTARALATLAELLGYAGDPGAMTLAERSLALARRTCHAEAIEHALWASGCCLTWAGHVAEARRALTEARVSYSAREDVRATSVLWLLALVELRAGRWDLAREYAEQRLELSEMLADGDPNASIPLALVAAHRGEEGEARRLAERGLELAEKSGRTFFASWHRGVLGLLAHWAGKNEQAVELFAAAMRIREAVGFREPASPLYRSDYVEALLALGRVDDALAVLEPWESRARRLGRDWALAETTRCRGLATAAQGEVADAEMLLEQAVVSHEAVGDPFGRGRALFALGTVRRRARMKRAARDALEQAVEAFEQLGASRWVERSRAELAGIGGRTRQDGLTAAEQRVASLVAEGRTNREVAGALFLSERTVESHLSSAYAKLGVRSRTELSRLLR